MVTDYIVDWEPDKGRVTGVRDLPLKLEGRAGRVANRLQITSLLCKGLLIQTGPYAWRSA